MASAWRDIDNSIQKKQEKKTLQQMKEEDSFLILLFEYNTHHNVSKPVRVSSRCCSGKRKNITLMKDKQSIQGKDNCIHVHFQRRVKPMQSQTREESGLESSWESPAQDQKEYAHNSIHWPCRDTWQFQESTTRFVCTFTLQMLLT